MRLRKLLGLSLVGVALACASCSKENEKMSYVEVKNDAEVALLCSNEEVVEVVGLDEEGDEVVEEIEDIEDMDINEAVIAITDKSIELGYLNSKHGDQTIFVGVTEDENGASQIEVDLNSALNDYLMKNNINVKVSKEKVIVDLGSASEWGVSEGKLKVISRIIDDNPELEVSVLVNKDMDELLEMIHEDMREYGAMSKEEKIEYRNALKELKEKYHNEEAMKKTIDLLKQKIDSVIIDEDVKKLLQVELATLEALFNEDNYEAFKNEVKEIKKEFSISYLD